MKTTLKRLKKFAPCKSGWKRLLDNADNDSDTELTIKQILDSNGIKDAVWALRAVDDQKSVRLFTCDVAESVLYLFEEKYPDDKRPRDAVEASRKFTNGEITKEELRVFAWAVDAAVNAAYADADADTDTAAVNAVSTAVNAVNAAYVANAAINAYAVTYVARACADAVACAVACVSYSVDVKKEQWSKIEKLLLKYL